MPSALSACAFILSIALCVCSCIETTCEDACKDQHDDCESEPPNTEQPLTCERQYTHCLAVCSSRPPDELQGEQ
jgi:hypothetical protein